MEIDRMKIGNKSEIDGDKNRGDDKEKERKRKRSKTSVLGEQYICFRHLFRENRKMHGPFFVVFCFGQKQASFDGFRVSDDNVYGHC